MTTPTAGHSSRVMTPTEWAKVHGVGRNLVYEEIRRGRLPHVRLGRKILIPIDALERMLASQEETPN